MKSQKKEINRFVWIKMFNFSLKCAVFFTVLGSSTFETRVWGIFSRIFRIWGQNHSDVFEFYRENVDSGSLSCDWTFVFRKFQSNIWHFYSDRVLKLFRKKGDLRYISTPFPSRIDKYWTSQKFIFKIAILGSFYKWWERVGN